MALRRIVTVTSPATAAAAPGEGLPAPNAYDLTDIPTVHNELKIGAETDVDQFLQRVLTEISLSVRQYAKRTFQIEGLSEAIYFDQGSGLSPGTVAPLPLSRWPIAGVTSLVASGETDSGTVLTFASVPSSVATGQPVSHRAVPWGTTVSSTTSTTVTLSQPLSTATPQLATQVLVGDTVDFGIQVALTMLTQQQLGAAQQMEPILQSLGPAIDYVIDTARGRLIRLNPFTFQPAGWEMLIVNVAYSAGYSPIPPDLVGAVLRWITWRYHARGVNPAIREQDQPGALGRVTYWVGGPPNSGGMPSEIVDMIDGRYRIPSAA